MVLFKSKSAQAAESEPLCLSPDLETTRKEAPEERPVMC